MNQARIGIEMDDLSLIASLKRGDHRAFNTIYRQMAPRLLSFIYSRVRDRELSEELMQEVFVSLWSKREMLEIHASLEAYLFGAAKFQILGYIRSEKMRHKYAEHLVLFAASELDNSTEDLLALTDLKAVLEEHIRQLPPKCQQAFRLSRFEYRSISEIASEMGISARTVENYLTQALKHLRTSLSQYHWLLLMALMFQAL